MSSSPDLLVSLIPDHSHERTSLANASARSDASFAHTPCTDVLLPVALGDDPQWTTGTKSRIHAYPGNTKLYLCSPGSRAWALDTGASHHMTNSTDGGTYTSRDRRRIHCGGSSVMSEGMSTIDGLRDVLVAPDLRPAGLASVAQLLDNSCPGSGALFTRTDAYFGFFAYDCATAISSRRGVSI